MEFKGKGKSFSVFFRCKDLKLDAGFWELCKSYHLGINIELELLIRHIQRVKTPLIFGKISSIFLAP
jgi:hypothetical protein